MVAIFLVLWIAITLPVRVSFYWDNWRRDMEDYGEQREWGFWLTADLFLDIFFMVDVVLNLNTGVVKDSE